MKCLIRLLFTLYIYIMGNHVIQPATEELLLPSCSDALARGIRPLTRYPEEDEPLITYLKTFGPLIFSGEIFESQNDGEKDHSLPTNWATRSYILKNSDGAVEMVAFAIAEKYPSAVFKFPSFYLYDALEEKVYLYLKGFGVQETKDWYKCHDSPFDAFAFSSRNRKLAADLRMSLSMFIPLTKISSYETLFASEGDKETYFKTSPLQIAERRCTHVKTTMKDKLARPTLSAQKHFGPFLNYLASKKLSMFEGKQFDLLASGDFFPRERVKPYVLRATDSTPALVGFAIYQNYGDISNKYSCYIFDPALGIFLYYSPEKGLMPCEDAPAGSPLGLYSYYNRDVIEYVKTLFPHIVHSSEDEWFTSPSLRTASATLPSIFREADKPADSSEAASLASVKERSGSPLEIAIPPEALRAKTPPPSLSPVHTAHTSGIESEDEDEEMTAKRPLPTRDKHIPYSLTPDATIQPSLSPARDEVTSEEEDYEDDDCDAEDKACIAQPKLTKSAVVQASLNTGASTSHVAAASTATQTEESEDERTTVSEAASDDDEEAEEVESFARESRDAFTQTDSKEMKEAGTQTDDFPHEEPTGWWLQHNPALYLTPPQKWTAPDDHYWFPTVFILALLHANLFDMQWAQDAAEKMRLPELRNFLQRKVIPQKILRNKKAGTIATALFSLLCTKLAQKTVEQMSQNPCTFFTWNSEDGKYHPHFNHMIMALWPLYIAERIGEELFFKPEK